MNHSRQLKSKGFTVIELLVVFSVIAILVALLLPAIQQAREASRRTTCKYNLKQIGIALHNYHDQHQAFPPGWVVGQVLPGTGLFRQLDRGCLWSWSAFLLPMLDQQSLYAKLNPGPADPPPIGDTYDLSLKVFLCPSDAGSSRSGWGLYEWDSPTTDPADNNPEINISFIEGYAKSNYPAVNGRSELPFTQMAPPSGIDLSRLHSKDEKGIFGFQTRTRIKDVQDGLSNTLAVGERDMTSPENWTSYEQNPRGAIWLRNYDASYVATDTTPMSNEPPPGIGDNCNAISVTGVTHPAVPINSDVPGRFSSLHSGGAHFLFADGSVKFISDSIDSRTYSFLGSMRDGQIAQLN